VRILNQIVTLRVRPTFDVSNLPPESVELYILSIILYMKKKFGMKVIPALGNVWESLLIAYAHGAKSVSTGKELPLPCAAPVALLRSR